MTSKNVCPILSLGTLWHFFNSYYYIFGTFMILGGLWLMIFGGRFFKITMFVAGQVSVAAFILIIMFTRVYPNITPMYVVWLTLMVSFGIGAGIGYAAQKWARVGVLLIGLWIGGLFGAIIYSMLFSVFQGGNPIGMLWMSIAFCGVIIGILSMIYFDHAVIVGSSLAGAYIFGRVRIIESINNSLFIGYLRVRRRFPKRIPSLSAIHD
jgi:hypothetical protein